RLVGLGSAVAEEALAGERPVGEWLRECPLGFHVPGVRHVAELSDLLADRLDHPRRTLAQKITAPARDEVAAAVPLSVPDPGTLTPDQADRVSAIVRDHIPPELGDRLRRALMSDLRQG